MELNDILYDLFVSKASEVTIEILSLGLGYTAVKTSDGGTGIAYTYFDSKKSCSVIKENYDYEGRPAVNLLEKIKSVNTIERSMALALINALNYDEALLLPEDENNNILFNAFDICKGTRVAMVGFFGPLINIFKERGASLEIIDIARGLGCEDEFYEKLRNWADVLFLTSTSILNNTTEEILGKAGKNLKTILLGPSTPMVPDAFGHLPVHMLAGTVPLEKDKVLKAIRHGMGTPIIHRFSRKIFWLSSS
ncbi:MAG: DUF364 domain-containing protein [Deltaproteobacteria bacterium]|nr:DUF364 domain-containing protein [Deltaproteobacteria bacterium]